MHCNYTRQPFACVVRAYHTRCAAKTTEVRLLGVAEQGLDERKWVHVQFFGHKPERVWIHGACADALRFGACISVFMKCPYQLRFCFGAICG